MIKYLFIILLLITTNSLGDDELTLKQQLDRLQREVNDISKLVYTNGSSENNKNSQIELSSSNLSSFDMRIYDIESDIKTIVQKKSKANKYIENKKINKIIFVKNRIINYIISN